VYNVAWNDSHRIWQRLWNAFVPELQAIHDAFVEFAQANERSFEQRSRDLYAARSSVSYLLPDDRGGLASFYLRGGAPPARGGP
jgi:hypothetical protein